MIGSSDANSSLVIFKFLNKCCFNKGAHEKDNNNVDANVWPPSGC